MAVGQSRLPPLCRVGERARGDARTSAPSRTLRSGAAYRRRGDLERARNEPQELRPGPPRAPCPLRRRAARAVRPAALLPWAPVPARPARSQALPVHSAAPHGALGVPVGPERRAATE